MELLMGLCGLTWVILLKVSWLMPNLEVYGERVPLVDLASLSIMLLPVFMEMPRISEWCLVHLWGARCQPFDTCIKWWPYLFLEPICAEYAMWIWSETMHLLYVFPSLYFFHFYWSYIWEKKMLYVGILFLYLMVHVNFCKRDLFLGLSA